MTRTISKIIFLLLSLIIQTEAVGMAQEEGDPKDNTFTENSTIINGDVALKGYMHLFSPNHDCVYAGSGKVGVCGTIDLNTILPPAYHVQPQDLLLYVEVYNDTITNFSTPIQFRYRTLNIGIQAQFPDKVFPSHLPYKLLKNVKEEDSLEITIDGVDYKLIAKQLQYKHEKKPFEKVLAIAVDTFKKNPNYFINDKQLLLDKKILKKDAWGRICHGPNGIKLSQKKSWNLVFVPLVVGTVCIVLSSLQKIAPQ